MTEGLVLNPSEAAFLILHSQSSIAKWRRSLDQAVSHHDIVKREHAAGAIAAIEALIEKLRAATSDDQPTPAEVDIGPVITTNREECA